VIDMFMGSLGEPDGGWPKKLQKIILRGREDGTADVRARTCRRSTSKKRQAHWRRRSAGGRDTMKC
jgi:pyruvate carboxylase